MKSKSKIFVSFVGINDAGKLNGKDDGAILTALKALKKVDKVQLLWSPTGNFRDIANYLKNEIINKKYCKNIFLHTFDLDNVTDHNEIYPKLLEFCKCNFKENEEVTAAIASGTPAMQVCWILMAESGDFNLKLIRSNEPKFSKSPITVIKLGTGLPKIIKQLESENKDLKKLLPFVNMNISKGELKIGNELIKLSPVQFAYYRYFLERAKEENEYERFPMFRTHLEFVKKIIKYHNDSFPESDQEILETVKLLKNSDGIVMGNFRSVISKINRKIKSILNTQNLSNYFIIESNGGKQALSYGISITGKKINIF
ncbi:MAG: hypothetical protein IT280_11965 [Ignavibacteria bacterium]|nr:hypothetical protein [Ignavibacteria bacterium]